MNEAHLMQKDPGNLIINANRLFISPTCCATRHLLCQTIYHEIINKVLRKDLRQTIFQLFLLLGEARETRQNKKFDFFTEFYFIETHKK
jgi:hypothetical protein